MQFFPYFFFSNIEWVVRMVKKFAGKWLIQHMQQSSFVYKMPYREPFALRVLF